jgi:hypothetical protein
MKNLALLLLSIVSLLSVSCSKDDDTVANPQNPESYILLKKITENNGDGVLGSITINYNGNKIAEVIDKDSKSIYTYTGDLITKVETYEGTTLTYQVIYSYLNDKLKTITSTYSYVDTNGAINVFRNKTVYTYNTDGTVLEERYTIDNATGAETKKNNTTVYTYANGNLTKTVETSTSTFMTTDVDGNPVTNTTVNKNIDTYEYDNKYNPLKNILGFSKILSGTQASANNVIKSTSISESTYNGVANPPSPSVVTDYIFKYNPKDYPIEQKYPYITYINNQPVTKTLTTQYFYQ